MNTATRAGAVPPWWYWIVSGLALAWMIIGVFVWTTDLLMDQAGLDAMNEEQRQLYMSRPQWLFAVYTIAIFSGLFGAVGLLVRRAWAKSMLAVSLVAIVVQFGYIFIVMNAIELFGGIAALPFPLLIFIIGALLLWLSIRAKKSGWIR